VIRYSVRTLTGFGFVVAFVTGALVYGSSAGKTAPQIAAYYADPNHRSRQIAGFAVVLVPVTLRFRWAGLPVSTALATAFEYIPYFVFLAWVAAVAVSSPREVEHDEAAVSPT
jgi:amino acid permease